MTSPLRRTEAVLADVPRPLRPIVWGIAALLTPLWVAGDLLRRGARGLWAVLRLLSLPFEALWRAVGALAGLLGQLLTLVLTPFRVLWHGLIRLAATAQRLIGLVLWPLQVLAPLVLAALRALRALAVPLRWLVASLRAIGGVFARAAARLGRLVAAMAGAVARATRRLVGALAPVGRLFVRLARATGRAVTFLGRLLWRPFAWTWVRVLVPAGKVLGRVAQQVRARTRQALEPVRAATRAVRETVRALRRR